MAALRSMSSNSSQYSSNSINGHPPSTPLAGWSSIGSPSTTSGKEYPDPTVEEYYTTPQYSGMCAYQSYVRLSNDGFWLLGRRFPCKEYDSYHLEDCATYTDEMFLTLSGYSGYMGLYKRVSDINQIFDDSISPLYTRARAQDDILQGAIVSCI